MVTVQYPEGLYVEPCDCHIDSLEREWKEACDEARDEGYNDGYYNGEQEGEERGRSDAEYEAGERIDELKKQLEQYSHLIEEDEYLDRIGT